MAMAIAVVMVMVCHGAGRCTSCVGALAALISSRHFSKSPAKSQALFWKSPAKDEGKGEELEEKGERELFWNQYSSLSITHFRLTRT
jgi:hypothetical protein